MASSTLGVRWRTPTASSSTNGRRTRLFGSIGAADADVALVLVSCHLHAPRVAAHLAVLDEGALHVRLDVDRHVFAAVRTVDDELIVHGADHARGRRVERRRADRIT